MFKVSNSSDLGSILNDIVQTIVQIGQVVVEVVEVVAAVAS